MKKLLWGPNAIRFSLIFLTCLFQVVFFLALLPRLVGGTTCTLKNEVFTATPLTPGELSTWVISVTLSDEASTYSITYSIPEGPRLQKGVTDVFWSGDVPCCYEKTISPNTYFGGGVIYLDFTQGPKTLTAGSTIILTVQGIKNPTEGTATIKGIVFYSSGPNEPAVASCMGGPIYVSTPTPSNTPTNTPTPLPPTSTPTPTTMAVLPTPTLNPTPTFSPTPITVPSVVPTDEVTIEPTPQSKPTASSVLYPTQPSKFEITPTLTISVTEAYLEKVTPTPVVDLSLLKKEEHPEKISYKKMVQAILLGELTSSVLVGMIVSSILLRSHL